MADDATTPRPPELEKMDIAAVPVPVPAEPWPPQWARSVAFLFGLALVGWETVIDQASHIVVYAIGFGLTGLPLARGLDKLLDRLPWGQK